MGVLSINKNSINLFRLGFCTIEVSSALLRPLINGAILSPANLKKTCILVGLCTYHYTCVQKYMLRTSTIKENNSIKRVFQHVC